MTGSAHCTLIPFWGYRLKKMKPKALQLSKRQGELFGSLNEDREEINGKAVKFLQGTIEI